jgi:hypothetical protein
MIALLPDWVLVVSTMLALAIFVTGRIRLAGVLAMPALMRFVAWPAFVALSQGVPKVVLIVIAVLAIPVILIRSVRMLLVLFVGEEATDHGIGLALGEWLVHLFARSRR